MTRADTRTYYPIQPWSVQNVNRAEHRERHMRAVPGKSYPELFLLGRIISDYIKCAAGRAGLLQAWSVGIVRRTERGGCWRRVSQLSYPELDLRDRSGIRARAGWPPPLLGPAAGMVYKCKDTFNDCNSVKLRPGCDQWPRAQTHIRLNRSFA